MNNDSNWNWGPGDSQLSPVPDREVKKWSGVKSLSCVQLFATPWTVAYHASPSMRFSRQQYQSGLPSPSPGDLPNPGIAPRSPTLQADALPSESPGKTRYTQSPGSPENPLDLESVWEGWGDENQGLSWIQSNPKQYRVSLVPNTQSLPPQPMAESGETLGSRLPRTVAGTQDAVSGSRSPTNKQVNGCRWWCLTHSLMWHLSPGPLTASPPIKWRKYHLSATSVSFCAGHRGSRCPAISECSLLRMVGVLFSCTTRGWPLAPMSWALSGGSRATERGGCGAAGDE